MNRQEKTLFWLEFVTDLTCIIIANIISYFLCHDVIHKINKYDADSWLYFGFTLLFAFLIIFVGFHTKIDIHKRNRIRELIAVLRNTTLTYLLFGTLMLLTKNPIADSRYLLVCGYIFFTAASVISRFFLKRICTGFYTKSKITSIAGVITTSDYAQQFVENVQSDWSLKVSGIVLFDNYINNESDTEAAVAVKEKIKIDSICDIPVIATDDSYMDWIRSSPIDEIFINLPEMKYEIIQPVIEEMESMGITVHINLPTLDKLLADSNFDNINCRMFHGYPIATFKAVEKNSLALVIKRFVDIILGLFGMIASIPIIAITAVPLLIESPGPLIFKQQRVGKNGRIFNIYKLRSMYVDAEERKAELMKQNKMEGLMFKVDDDPRITKVGKFIRKTSIDELPQFFNVVKGDMSLIGTRPPTIDEFEQYESRHKRRLSMRPGISGMWQVSGRSDIQDFEDVVKLDCKYIDEWSLALDIKILFKTVGVVLTHKGAE